MLLSKSLAPYSTGSGGPLGIQESMRSTLRPIAGDTPNRVNRCRNRALSIWNCGSEHVATGVEGHASRVLS